VNGFPWGSCWSWGTTLPVSATANFCPRCDVWSSTTISRISFPALTLQSTSYRPPDLFSDFRETALRWKPLINVPESRTSFDLSPEHCQAFGKFSHRASIPTYSC